MDPAIRGAKEAEARRLYGIAQLEAIFKVSCAYDAGKIKKHNDMAIDARNLSSLQRFIN